MRREVNVKEQSEKKNDVEDTEKAKGIQKKEGERGWIKEQECRAADAMLLSACVNPAQFLNSVSIRQHVISSALLCLDPAVDGAVRGHVMKGRCPLRFFNATSLTYPYVRAHQHNAGLNSTVSLMIMFAV